MISLHGCKVHRQDTLRLVNTCRVFAYIYLALHFTEHSERVRSGDEDLELPGE